jgi:hypothetical protein
MGVSMMKRALWAILVLAYLSSVLRADEVAAVVCPVVCLVSAAWCLEPFLR